jgi:hypothetical protein
VLDEGLQRVLRGAVKVGTAQMSVGETAATSYKGWWPKTRPDSSATYGQYFCRVLWASANGHEVWTQCGTRQLVIVGGHATRVRLAWLLPSITPSGSVFAW